MMNGDILTALDFRALLNFHFEHRAEMTVAVREYGFDVPYGVVDTDGLHVTAVTEKPTVKFFVNAGIYLISPSARQFIPTGQSLDMPELIDRLVQAGRNVISFPWTTSVIGPPWTAPYGGELQPKLQPLCPAARPHPARRRHAS